MIKKVLGIYKSLSPAVARDVIIDVFSTYTHITYKFSSLLGRLQLRCTHTVPGHSFHEIEV